VKQAILWDNDGVLVDTEHLYFQATREILAPVGVELTEALYRELLLVQAKGAWHLAQERGVGEAEVASLKRARDARYSELLVTEPILLPESYATLKRLHGKFRMGIVTSSRKEHFELIHRRTGMLELIEFTVASGDYGRPKPDPEPYLVALERLGLPPEECVVVEDSLRGLTAARGAGIDCYVVPTALTRGSGFSGAVKVLERVSEVVDELAGVDTNLHGPPRTGSDEDGRRR